MNSEQIQELDCYESETALEAICKAREITLAFALQLPRKEHDYKGAMEFTCMVTSKKEGAPTIETRWSAGLAHAVPDKIPKWYTRAGAQSNLYKKDWETACAWLRGQHTKGLSMHHARICEGMISEYKPTAFAIVSGLLTDQSCVEGYDEMDEWLEDLGYSESMETVRKGEKAWREIRATSRDLRKLFGDQYQSALELSNQL